MSIRESIDKHKGISVAAVCLLLISAASVILWGNSSGVPGPLTKMYFSDDDGKTYFVDASTQLCPFDHSGKPACRAYVYQCGSEKPFVLYLERYTDEARQKLAELAGKSADPVSAELIATLTQTGLRIKKPGDAAWVSPNTAAGMEMVIPKCPAGGSPHGVYP